MIIEEQQKDLILLMNDITETVTSTIIFENLQYALLLSNILITMLSVADAVNIQLDFFKALPLFQKINENNRNEIRNKAINAITRLTRITKNLIKDLKYNNNKMIIVENIKNILYYYMILLYMDEIDIVTLYAKNKKIMTSAGII